MKRVLSLLCGTILLATIAPVPDAGAQGYPVGAIVTNDFGMQNRLRWTNDAGRIFTSSNSQIRLSDFDGKIVFFCFFDVW